MDTDCRRSGWPRMHANDVSAAYLPISLGNNAMGQQGGISMTANISISRTAKVRVRLYAYIRALILYSPTTDRYSITPDRSRMSTTSRMSPRTAMPVLAMVSSIS